MSLYRICLVLPQRLRPDALAFPLYLGQPRCRIANGDISSASVGIINYGELNIGDTASLTSANNAIINYGGTVNSAGSVITTGGYNAFTTYGGTLNITGGHISALYDDPDSYNEGSAIAIFNRTYNTDDSQGAEVNISGGYIESYSYAASVNNVLSRGSNLTITGGTLKSHRTAIYWPASFTLTMGTEGSTDGPVITSTNGSAVEVCSGTLIVYGGTLNGGTDMTNDDSIPTDQSWVDAFRANSGSSGIGDAITVIASRSSGYDSAALNVEIHGGEFTSSKNYAVRYMDCNLSVNGDNAGDKIKQEIKVEINGGRFSGELSAVDASFVKDENLGFISGGNYSDPLPKDYLDYSLNAELYSTTNTDAPYSYYTNVETALKAAQPGDVVTDLSEVTDETRCEVKLDNNGTVDTVSVPNGATITLTAPTRSGYEFRGWRGSDGKLYKAGTEYKVSGDVPSPPCGTPLTSPTLTRLRSPTRRTARLPPASRTPRAAAL